MFFSFITIPWMISFATDNISSVAKKISGIEILLEAESSKVRSRSEFAALSQVTLERDAIYREREHIFSEFWGLRLNGIADEPTCFCAKGSINSPKGADWSILKSNANL